jgi:hypothetical protein
MPHQARIAGGKIVRRGFSHGRLGLTGKGMTELPLAAFVRSEREVHHEITK